MAATQYAIVATGAGNTIVRSSPGTIAKVVVTVAGTGTGSVNFYDNPSTNAGNILLALPATVSVGTIYAIDGSVKIGIVVANVANGPGLTVYFD